jgi:hypothetical protein
MSEKKLVGPEGMLNAGRSAYSAYVTAEEGAKRILEAGPAGLMCRCIGACSHEGVAMRVSR